MSGDDREQCVSYIHPGMTDTSAVTMLFTPRLDRAPLTRPQVKARYCRDKWVSFKLINNAADYREMAKIYVK